MEKVLFGGNNYIIMPQAKRLLGTLPCDCDEIILDSEGNSHYVQFHYEGKQTLKKYTLKHQYADNEKVITVSPNVYWYADLGRLKQDIKVKDVVRFSPSDKGWIVTKIEDSPNEDSYSLSFNTNELSLIIEGTELVIKKD